MCWLKCGDIYVKTVHRSNFHDVRDTSSMGGRFTLHLHSNILCNICKYKIIYNIYKHSLYIEIEKEEHQHECRNTRKIKISKCYLDW